MTELDARSGCKELFEEGYSFSAVRIYLNDLVRGKDITHDVRNSIMSDIITGQFGDIDIGINTF